MGAFYTAAKTQTNPPYTAVALPFGDSITLGSTQGTNLLAAWREPLYDTANAAAPPNLWFIGTQNFGGYGGGLDGDPYCAGYSGYTIRDAGGLSAGSLIVQTPIEMAHQPAIAIMLGGTNDIAVLGDSASTVAASWSTWLDDVWNARPHNHFQIVVGTIMKRLDSYDTVVQATNALLPAIVAGKSYVANITLVPIYNCIVNQTIGGAGGYYDVVHPSDVGNQNMATAWWASLQPVLKTAVGG